MRFGQRFGYTTLPEALSPEAMPEALRNALWNVFNGWKALRGDEIGLLRAIWGDFWGLAVDTIPIQTNGFSASYGSAWARVRKAFFENDWFYVYEFFEFLMAEFDPAGRLSRPINKILEEQLAAYRIVDGKFVRVTDTQELDALSNALSRKDKFASVAEHVATAMALLSDRKKPDYRNSIKESISAVEAMARIVSGDSSATLNKALQALEKSGRLHPCLKRGYSALYEYTNDADGIRHALMDKTDLNADDAKFFLLACASFVNYLKSLI